MNILHINSYFSTSGLFDQLYQRQLKAGHKLEVYVPISYEYPEDRIACQNVYTHVSRTFHQYERFVFPLKHYHIWHDLVSHYNFSRYDLVHAHSLFSNGWLAHKVYKEFGIPYVVAVRSADVRTFMQKMPWMRSTGWRILQDAKAIIFISENFRREVFDCYVPDKYKHEFARKTQVIGNGISAFWHNHPNPEKKTQVHHPIRIVSSGKISQVKGFVPLAQKIAEFSRTHGPVELHLAGANWEPKILEQLQAFPFFRYHGKLSQAELAELFRQMDIFALLSSRETFGLVYPEAMSQGLPVIYTQGEGFDAFFDNYQVGVSVDRTNQEAFNKGLEYILAHYGELSLAAQEGSKIFNWDKINASYDDLYRKIL